MTKFLNANGRIVLFDQQHHSISGIKYSNDRMIPGERLFSATQGLVDTLILSGSLRLIQPTTSR